MGKLCANPSHFPRYARYLEKARNCNQFNRYIERVENPSVCSESDSEGVESGRNISSRGIPERFNYPSRGAAYKRNCEQVGNKPEIVELFADECSRRFPAKLGMCFSAVAYVKLYFQEKEIDELIGTVGEHFWKNALSRSGLRGGEESRVHRIFRERLYYHVLNSVDVEKLKKARPIGAGERGKFPMKTEASS